MGEGRIMTDHPEVSTRLGLQYSQSGFTLIEVLIAMTLLMFGILSVTGFQVICISGNASARMQTEATALGTQVLERLRMLPREHPDLDTRANPHELERAGSRSYSVRWVVTENAPTAATKTVSVMIIPDNRANGRPVTITTILAR